ncbi:hypothetical protein IAD21_03598 [Abditibacteriota bacterium]|nr:hypothetical protein IAD21_03598 [Abditibacteriota bacterium]
MDILSCKPIHSRVAFDGFVTDGGSVSFLGFSPNGRWLVSVSGLNTRVWETAEGTFVGEIKGVAHAFIPNGDLLCGAWSGCGHRIEVVTCPGGEVVTSFEEEASNAYSLVVSPDGQTIAAGGYQQVHLWDANSGAKLRSFPTHSRVTTDLAFTPDSRKLVTRNFGNMAVWSLAGELVTSLRSVEIGAPNDRGQRLAVSPQGLIAANGGRMVELRTLSGKRPALWKFEHYVSSLAFNPAGTILAVGTQKGDVHLVDMASHEVALTLTGPRWVVSALAWHRDGSLAAGWRDNIDLWSDRALGQLTPKAAPRADDGDVSRRLERIRTKIELRGVHLQPPLSMKEVEEFEATHCVVLPLGYRRFITEIGNGGKGPPAYDWAALGENGDLPQHLDVPFPLTENSVWEGEEEPLRTELSSAAWSGGYLYLGTEGCGMNWVLIVTGLSRGQIWDLCWAGACSVNPRRDFLSWYEYWLDGGRDVQNAYDEDVYADDI